MPSATWSGVPERLDRVLPALDLARSRSQAAEYISSGRVTVGGEQILKASFRVSDKTRVSVDGVDHYVSRAAHKLIAGLDEFNISAEGLLALDVGASTGGFTQVLLERGAKQVIALDVGHDQLVESLRNDSKVCVVEGCNARELTSEMLTRLTKIEETPELIVADISFISLELVLPALCDVSSVETQFVLLIKPQFEVGRGGIRDGIVVDQVRAANAVVKVVESAGRLGLQARGLILSPISGEHGNREVLVHFVRSAPSDQSEWEQHIHALFESEGAA